MDANAKSLVRYIVPALGGFFVTYLYNVVDGIFVGQGVGSAALGAVNIAVPFITFVVALTAMFPMGGGTVVAIRMGRGDKEGANRAFMTAFLLTLVSSAVLMAVGMIFPQQIVDLSGGKTLSAEMRSMAAQYLFYYSAFSIPMLMGTCLSVFVRNDGSPALSFVGMCAGAAANIFLDWLFIFPLRMGIIGAAVASGLGQVLTVLLLLTHFLRKKGSLRIRSFQLDGALAAKVCKRGVPEAVTQLTTPITALCYNLMLARLVGDIGEVKLREQHIAAATDEMPQSIYNANILAKKLHPAKQFVKVAKVVDHGDAKSFVLVPDPARGTEEMAYFRAGQYTTVEISIGGATLWKPYSICSGPADALKGSYTITVRRSKGGYVSEYILDNWQEGTEAVISGPQGDFYYLRLRDAKHIVAMAGGSGITPFHSMACAIADGIEDFDLTILYGNRTRESILLRDEIDAVAARSNGRVKIVHVLSDEEVEGYEHGFITAELIKKYAGDGDYSLFLCGPKAMYAFADTQIAALGLPRRRARKELYGDYGDPARSTAYPASAAGKTYTITVTIRGETQTVSCRADQTLLSAMEQAGIKAPSRCRSGECGWCHSLLLSGEVFVPAEADGRREADKKFGWIHPCCTYPLSDVSLDVPAVI